jgi:N-acetylglucosaminyldiphosphoundecaprenol N-acetyl-beta-D-mannosaminyltransferase
MIDRGKHNVAGVRVDAVDYEAAVDKIIRAAHDGQPLAVAAVSVHGVMVSVRDKTHRYRLNSLDLVVPDGQPVRWALNFVHGAQLRERVYGPQMMFEVCRRAAAEGVPIFILGSHEKLLGELRQRLTEKLPGLRIAGCKPAEYRSLTLDEHTALVEEIRASGARIALVGLGCPRQEVFVYEMRDTLSMPVLAVGAALNFHAGDLDQAPPFMQRWGLEWAFRLCKEPRRLWRRYLVTNPFYLALFALQASGLYVIEPTSAVPPNQEMRYG